MELKNTDVKVSVGAEYKNEMFTEEHFPLAFFVEKGEKSQVLMVEETEKDDSIHRTFMIEGIPKEMFDEEIVAGVAKKLGLHMQELVEIK